MSSAAQIVAEVDGVAPVVDAELSAALADLPASPTAERGRQRLAAILDDGKTGSCDPDVAAVRQAIDELAAGQAAGVDVRDDLLRGYGFLLRCADSDYRPDEAMRTAALIRELSGDDQPPGIAPELMSQYPPLDAVANHMPAEVQIETQPPGALIWIDHRPLGRSPMTAHIREGEHLIAASHARGTAVQRTVVTEASPPVTLTIQETAGEWWLVRERVRAWRDGSARVTAETLSALMDQIGAQGALLVHRDHVLVWAQRPTSVTAEEIGNAASISAAASLLVDAAATWRNPGLDPAVPLMREDDDEDDLEADTSWWVYAGIAGAVGLGVAAVVAHELASDVQRIEVVIP